MERSTLPPAHEADPGKGWRRLALFGAILCILVVFLPFRYPETLWETAGRKLRWIFVNWQVVHYFRGTDFPLDTICDAFFFAGLLNGVGFLWLCNRPASGAKITGKSQAITCLISGCILEGVSTLYPYFTFVGIASKKGSAVLGIALAIGNIALLFTGLSLVAAWRRRFNSTWPLWCGLLPLLALDLFWFAECYEVLISLLSRPSIPWIPLANYLLPFRGITFAFPGVLMLSLGWLLWWRAVARYERQRDKV